MPLKGFRLLSDTGKELMNVDMEKNLEFLIAAASKSPDAVNEVLKDCPKGKVSWLMRRADLLQSLQNSLQDKVTFHFNTRLIDCKQHSEGVEVVLDGGQTITGDMLIGCDGIKSQVRKIIHGISEPKFSGHVLAGGITYGMDQSRYANSMWQYSGNKGLSFLIAPFNNEGAVTWGLGRIADSPKHESWNAQGNLKEIIEASKNFPEEVQEVVRRSQEPIVELGLYYRKHVSERAWFKGRIFMIGDASHATLPWIGQGANMAICDAACLAKELMHRCDEKPTNSQITDAFQATQSQRVQNVAIAVQLAKYIGMLFHTKNPLVGAFRDFFYPKLLGSRAATTALWKDLGVCGNLLDSPRK